eukprot:2885547-Pleurochrysis_carterae.AAC.1
MSRSRAHSWPGTFARAGSVGAFFTSTGGLIHQEQALQVARMTAALALPPLRFQAASDHPHSGSARLGCGWAELFVILPVADADGAEPREIELPQRPDFYQGVTQPCTLQASTISDGSDCSVSDGEHETQTVFLTHSSDDEEHELTENLLSSRASDSE